MTSNKQNVKHSEREWAYIQKHLFVYLRSIQKKSDDRLENIYEEDQRIQSAIDHATCEFLEDTPKGYPKYIPYIRVHWKDGPTELFYITKLRFIPCVNSAPFNPIMNKDNSGGL